MFTGLLPVPFVRFVFTFVFSCFFIVLLLLLVVVVAFFLQKLCEAVWINSKARKKTCLQVYFFLYFVYLLLTFFCFSFFILFVAFACCRLLLTAFLQKLCEAVWINSKARKIVCLQVYFFFTLFSFCCFCFFFNFCFYLLLILLVLAASCRLLLSDFLQKLCEAVWINSNIGCLYRFDFFISFVCLLLLLILLLLLL